MLCLLIFKILAILVHANLIFLDFFIVGITDPLRRRRKMFAKFECTTLLAPGEENPSELGINLRLFDRANYGRTFMHESSSYFV